jgi:cellobionic acid phosphorylase
MGMSFVKPAVDARRLPARAVAAGSQRRHAGRDPAGEGAELKYINQVPHTDHCVWLPVCLQGLPRRDRDYALLDEHGHRP